MIHSDWSDTRRYLRQLEEVRRRGGPVMVTPPRAKKVKSKVAKTKRPRRDVVSQVVEDTGRAEELRELLKREKLWKLAQKYEVQSSINGIASVGNGL